ncbi:Acg family FMN-binding oxidoreductase [Peterkaempfera sp. SMS 1(5)a]|uniref:Acg family FMN-binding oxidoreductase n=1 Tax=Peterkaempfera podocarpi TaxID=3232308 RepID=UPI00366AF009
MQQPAVDAAALEDLLRAAVAAPSIHNTQPWRFHLDLASRTVEVGAAPARELAVADPGGRAVHLSVGAAVFNLRTAAAHQGWEPVTRLLPDPARPEVLAAVHLAGPPDAPRATGGHNGHAVHNGHNGHDLYESIWLRHSSRLPFTGDPVPQAVLDELLRAAESEQAQLHFPDGGEASRLLGITTDAERRNNKDPARRAETAAWCTPGNRPDQGHGIPAAALGMTDAEAHIPMRDFTGHLNAHPRPAAHFEHDPQLLLLATRQDNPADWLRAGQAMQKVLLVLTARGLVASFLHQALEWKDLRWLLRDPHAGLCNPQALLRIGYGPVGAATPRRAPMHTVNGADHPQVSNGCDAGTYGPVLTPAVQ